jgi:PKD repeat protein
MKRLKGFMLCVVMLAALICLAGQTQPEWQWAVQAGGTNNDEGEDIAVDALGNQYIIGYFKGTASFGPYTLTSAGENDIFAAKLDPAGNFIWAVRAGGTSSDYGYGIAVDAQGNQYIIGDFYDTASFGPYTLTSAGGHDVFAAKLDPAGNFLWAVRAGGTGTYDDWGNGIAVDGVGNTWLTGNFDGTASFGPYSLTSAGGWDVFAAKLDPAGNFLWAHRAGGEGFDNGNGIAVDGAGNALLTGEFQSTADFGSHTLTTAGSDDIFAAKLDPAGNFLWAVRAGGTSSEDGNDIAVDGAGNSWLTGAFHSSTATFGPFTLTSAGSPDIFAAKLDPAGNFLWAVRAGGTSGEAGWGIAVDGAGNAWLTGGFLGEASFGLYTLTSAGSGDIFAAKLDPAGNFLWAVRAGGTGNDRCWGIAVDGAGNACLTGFFYGTATFGPYTLTSASAGFTDVFAAKLKGPFAADFAADLTYGMAPLTVQFTDFSTPGNYPITNWLWNFGDGGSSTEQNPSHTYLNPGSYSVSLLVMDQANNMANLTRTDYITVIERVQTIDLISNESLNFGGVYLEEQSAYQSVTFANTGNVDLTISALHFSSDPLHFEFVDPSLPLVLSPGAVNSILVRFAPQAVGYLFDTLYIENDSYNLPVIAIALAGTGEYVPPLPPGNVDLVMDGINAVITWEPVTQNTHNQPLTPDYYIIFYNGSSDPENGLYYYLGRSWSLSYYHDGVGLHAQHMFYRVVAYKYYGRGEPDLSALEPGMREDEVLRLLR